MLFPVILLATGLIVISASGKPAGWVGIVCGVLAMFSVTLGWAR